MKEFYHYSKHYCLILIIILSASCSAVVEREKNNKVENSLNDFLEFYDSELFKAVQLKGVFKDSKTFVDCIPKSSLKKIQISYLAEKDRKNFDLKEFLNNNFELPEDPKTEFETDQLMDMYDHIESLWPVLTRTEDTIQNSSLIPLPNPYVVPGGRFREIYYWDSYFTMLGLKASGKEDLAISMLDNFAFLIDSLGFIPNGNRAYYTGRSQPPFFSLMVDELTANNRSKFISYQPQLLKEYEFWMKGSEKLSEVNPAINRVVLLEGDIVLNRYFDEYAKARPESFKEDYELVHENDLDEDKTFRDLRAGAESGWDYSSRWFADPQEMKTIQTTDIIPIDLNVLLYFLEVKIAQAYNWNEQLDSADIYLEKANNRKNAINSLLWNEKDQRYADYNFRKSEHTKILSMASAYPLFAKIAPKDKARMVMKQMKNRLLLDGGFVSTTVESGQQWDYPNAWAPLQWIGIQALFNYGEHEAGLDVMNRWLSLNEKVYQQTGKMMEKYNVADTSLQAGGGEYPLQDGFGWTNGVAVAMKKILQEKEELALK
ncbi:alpha,alpha-trehalase TreF [Marivirga salinae]|uniref:Alpha,alpha-trehalase TreF n=1 Tax=Marivirga salinarum TaxID=3059078 RepID=A0AA51N9P5_9BACT|nr:alpha,alpha-trehalase TreF [Marivirga sp. BDSF4-3]WMN10865.1 alpha,alpha-trehalase TreF [Marivirga sp. BDSF4-3]